jgi:hypothetical protein
MAIGQAARLIFAIVYQVVTDRYRDAQVLQCLNN